ncbi:MAG: hypothetical protein ACRDOY_07685 [Nocardioidaceae bacterium]
MSELAAADLELLARSSYMLGRDDEYVASLERAHHAHLKAAAAGAAVRWAIRIGSGSLATSSSASHRAIRARCCAHGQRRRGEW